MPESKTQAPPSPTDHILINGHRTSLEELSRRWTEERLAGKKQRFQALLQQWRLESAALSSVTEMSMLPSYQKIIGLGEDAVPLILAQLAAEGDEPDQWFWALRVLTDANPVEPGDQGNYSRMANAWLQWGEREGHAG